ncbi:MAG: iron-sulfur cluster assembly scaffold protein [Planctomycetaceae bacterium]|nr:iron-sulfur cluster assembly scaffold protein [Planctomycetaceae bacterium]
MNPLTDHFRIPYHRGIPTDISWRDLRTNPLCGDEVRVGLQRHSGDSYSLFQEGRGCLVSQAAASLLCEEVEGWTLEELKTFREEDLLELFEFELTPRRKRCALLAWEALRGVVEQVGPG